ncbi:heat shock factor protein [Rutstroemia sp. NJR-2017a WRK4]|nr:heat shock factor protein [Rutstroemia sp. NJR-2017a WRK4]
MPPTNPRKRPAPAASPTIQSPQMQQTYNAGSQLSNADFLRWAQNPDNQSYTDPSTFNVSTAFGTNGLPQTSTAFDQPITTPSHSTQLARRPHNTNRQLVQSAQRTFDTSGDLWAQFGDEAMMDAQNGQGSGENDDIEALEEKAAIAKREAQAKRKQIPPFVQKLSSFLDESKNTELIRWSDRGDSFVVLDEDEFAKTLIPELFKHNNYASFVRQLNMYGFHKRVGLSDNSMKASERKNKSPSEYYNPYFKRGHPNLLWLINKPKGGNKRPARPGARVKNEDLGEIDSDEEIRDMEDPLTQNNYSNNTDNSRALSAAPESGPLQRREIALVRSQISDIQKQQNAISQAITRLRKDHNQLYQQAVAFKNLHERHESSINAILTFLATVYNRSLDGQGAENITRMFQAGLNTEGQHQQQGNVVDIGELATPQEKPEAGSSSPNMRKAQRLLMAPPHRNQPQSGTATPAATSPQPQYTSPRSGTVEELFESSPSDTTATKTEPQGMLNLINNTNAKTRTDTNAMEFPDMLSHYENANGNSPLTSEQRSNMLNMMASTTSAPGSNNALVSPAPQAPNLDDIAYTQAEIEDLLKMQTQQQDRIQHLSAVLGPEEMQDGAGYFTGEGGDPGAVGGLDLDQFLDSGAYFGGSPGYGFEDYAGGGAGVNGGDGGFVANGVGESHFDVGMDGLSDGGGGGAGAGRIVETGGSSGGSSPMEDVVGLEVSGVNGVNGHGGVVGESGNGSGSGNKRRRRG